MSDLFSLFQKAMIIDLTHALSAQIPSWDGSLAFSLRNEDQISMLTSTGTHIDAPAHFIKEGMTIDQLPIHRLFGPACVIDVSKKADADYQVSPQDVEEYEAKYGPIPEHSIVVGYTGWSRHWNNPKAYRNADSSDLPHYPTFAASTIELLLTRKIAGVAIDTLALEPINSSFPAHQLLLGSGKFIIENLANASQLPPKGAYILALPLKIEKCGEAPARVFAILQE